MDGQRFDELARRLGSGTSRRGVLKGIAAGIGASVFGFTIRQTPAVRAGVDNGCETNEDCGVGEFCYLGEGGGTCQLICVATGGACQTTDECCDLDVCTGGVCTVPASCSGEGQTCGEVPCCSGLTCFQATCTSTPPTCSEEGDPCSEIACCSGTGLVCDSGTGTCVYQTCAGEKGGCKDDYDCCDGLYCEKGYCEVIPACGYYKSGCKDDYDCCDGFYCNKDYCEYVVEPCGGHKVGCKDDYDCCDGLICSDKYICEPAKGVCGAPGALCEMVEDHGCCAGLTCFEGQCDNPSGLCMDEWEYCDGKYITCCKGLVCGNDYYCHVEKHDDKPAEPPAPKPQGSVAVTTLPSTGSGDGDNGASWINAAALGGAAAVIGGALLKKKSAESDQQS